MSDKRATRRAKRQGQSHPKSHMQALGDILYANEQKSRNAFLYLHGGSTYVRVRATGEEAAVQQL